MTDRGRDARYGERKVPAWPYPPVTPVRDGEGAGSLLRIEGRIEGWIEVSRRDGGRDLVGGRTEKIKTAV